MANLLSVEKPKKLYFPVELDADAEGFELIDEYSERLKFQFNYEKMFWYDFNKAKFSDVTETMDD